MSIDPDELLAQVQQQEQEQAEDKPAEAEQAVGEESQEADLPEDAEQHQPQPEASYAEVDPDDLLAEFDIDVNQSAEDAPVSDSLEQQAEQAQPGAENWPLPDFTEAPSQDVEPPSNFLNIKPTWYDQEPEEEEPEIEFQPMTIEELEELRQAAYEEGKAEGFQAGHQEGVEAGHAEGLAKGLEEGQQQGLAEGLEQGQQQIKELSERWMDQIQRLHQPNQLIEEEVKRELIDLACKLAQEIVKVELVTNPEIIVQTLKEAVQALPIQKQQIQISLNPADLEIIQQVFPADTIEKKQWQLLADGSIHQGDCLVETELSSVSVEMEQVIKQALQRFARDNSGDDELTSQQD